MIVSLERGIAFICVPKCASTSIELALQPYADISLAGHPSIKHIRARDYQRFILPLLRKSGQPDPVTFCLMREPLDWANSWYRYRSRKALANPGHEFHQNFTGAMSFETFIEAMLENDPPGFARLDPQSDVICDETGKKLVDQVFRYENLDPLLDWLREKTGNRRLRLKRKNVSPRGETELSEILASRFRTHNALDYALYESLD